MAMLQCSCLLFNSVQQCYSVLVCYSILYGMLQHSCLLFNSIWQSYSTFVCYSILYGIVTAFLSVIQFHTAMLQALLTVIQFCTAMLQVLSVIQFYIAMLQRSCLLFNSTWQCNSALLWYSILYGNALQTAFSERLLAMLFL